jgi:hypothetical protein
MAICIAIAVPCWVSLPIAVPCRLRSGAEVEELVSVRLLARQHWLTLLATPATGIALLVTVLALPGRVDTGLLAQRQAEPASCPSGDCHKGSNDRIGGML